MGMDLLRFILGLTSLCFGFAAGAIYGIPGLIGGLVVHFIVFNGLMPLLVFCGQTLSWNRRKRDQLR